jgi:SAM-dependent methyltransferase
MPTREELIAAYEQIPVNSWTYETPGCWKETTRCIHDLAPNRRILDVGCFRGDFLASLGEAFEKYGIEPNSDAAAVAEGRSITIIGREATDELTGREGFFGAIVLMDVAEHVPDPAAVFRHLGKYLAPGGALIVLTGNAEHWLPRRSLPFYWYMSFPIHLVYLSEGHFRWVARNDGWRIARSFRYSHKNYGWRRRLRETIYGWRVSVWKNWLSKSNSLPARSLSRLALFRRVARLKTPPNLFCVNDHVGVALVKR